MELIIYMNQFLLATYLICVPCLTVVQISCRNIKIPSPLARCLLLYLALEECLQILEARPESSTLSSWAIVKFSLVCVHSSLWFAFLFYQFH